MLSLNDASNYSTWFYFWWTQDGAAQRDTPGYNGNMGIPCGASNIENIEYLEELSWPSG